MDGDKIPVRDDQFPVPATVYGLFSTRDNLIRFVGQTTGLPEWSVRKLIQKARTGVTSPVATWCRGEMEVGYEIRMQIIVEAGTINETMRDVVASAERRGWDLLNVRPTRRDTGKDRNHKKFDQATRQRMKSSSIGRKHSADTKAKIGESCRDSARRRTKVALSF